MSRLIKSLGFENLSFHYEGQEPLLKNINFVFPVFNSRSSQDKASHSQTIERRRTASRQAEIVVIRGTLGSGSSTLLQILAGLQIPTSGSYLINGIPVEKMSFEEFLPFRLRIGYGFGMGGLICNRTLFENLVLPLNYHKFCSQQEATDHVLTLMDRFDLMKYKDLRIAYVSPSHRKITVLIRAVIMKPEVLLLDDPNIRVSTEIQQMYAELLREQINNGNLHTIFITSFDESFFSYFDYTSIYIEGTKLITMHEFKH
ncbi:MAG: ATP-binding cassette domain-containing protein [Methylococcales bacterium]|nr:ATP-binding cassette domain-containing protein [Methylococcales bacterium]